MKKTLLKLKFFSLLFLLIAGGTTRAQLTLSVNGGANTQCYTGANTATAAVTTTVAGATSYSWTINSFTSCAATFSNAVSNGSIINIWASCAGQYSICCSAMNGTTVLGFQCTNFYVSPNPTITIFAASPTVCAGSSNTLSGSGAISYTWTLPGSPTFSFAGATAVVSPTSTGVYTLSGSNGSCTSASTVVILVNPSPTVTITASNLIVCNNTTCTLTAFGASNYTWSTYVYAASSVVVPTINTCYYVTGASVQGCTSTAVQCITVMPSPAVTIAGNNTVCLGSSTTFTVSGAVTYTWSTGANTSTLNVLPLTSTNYTLFATGSNGCSNYNLLSVTVDTTCSNVWPGDANSDGVVDNTDVFEIGLAFSNTGAPRSPGGNTYTSQYATNWTGTVSSGKNKCHADCDGDGTINNGDTVAIYNNYSLTHSFKPSETATTNGDINLVSTPGNVAIDAMWNKVDIMMGSNTNVMNQLYGVAFDINYDNSLIQTNSAYIVYTSSFLNASNQNVQFRKTDFSNSKVYAASVRTNGNNVSGFGKIGEFWFQVKFGMEGSTLNLSVSNANATDKNGAKHSLSGGTAALQIASVVDPVGVKEQSLFAQAVQFFPNPASNQLSLQSSIKTPVTYFVYDIAGREVAKGVFTGANILDISNFENGSYIVRLQSGSLTSNKKLVIEK